MSHKGETAPILRLTGSGLQYPGHLRELWSGLDLSVQPGEFLAVLGSNGSGKTSLLRCLLGLQTLTSGTLEIGGSRAVAGRRRVGYVPQQRRLDPLTPLRARDMVGFGVDGHRWGIGGLGGIGRRARIEAALAEVGAAVLADAPVASLSGGQQQLIRIAQALAGDPDLLLCDEPLLSLDINHQSAIAAVVHQRRLSHRTAVVFVTHEINPVLTYVDRVLYLAGRRFAVGTVDEVMTSAKLSDLYGAPVDVLRVNGRIVVLGIPESRNRGAAGRLDAG